MAVPDPEIPSGDLARIADFVRARCGIDLDETKGYLVESRWRHLCREYGGITPLQLMQLAEGGDSELAKLMIEEISTKETSFFRDASPFELLRSGMLRRLLEHATQEQRSLEIWSAACSTGQEVYSLAMTAVEVLTPAECAQIRITGADLSRAALSQATDAIYGDFELSRGVDESRRQRHFVKADKRWRVRDPLRSLVRFAKVNLIDLPPVMTRYDLIFCRNIATYFDISHRGQLFEALARRLRPHGVLVLGATESLIGVTNEFVREREVNTTYSRHR